MMNPDLQAILNQMQTIESDCTQLQTLLQTAVKNGSLDMYDGADLGRLVTNGQAQIAAARDSMAAKFGTAPTITTGP